MMDAIFYILRTGIQWKAFPREYGAPSTVHDRFQEWRDAGVFEVLWMEALCEFDAKVGIDWTWQSADHKHGELPPWAGRKPGQTPWTERKRA